MMEVPGRRKRRKGLAYLTGFPAPERHSPGPPNEGRKRARRMETEAREVSA
jgi:hypothetical protein